jgi:FkbH-like protein
MEFLDYIKKAATHGTVSPDDFSTRMKVTILTDFTDDIVKNLFVGAMLANGIYPTIHQVPYRQYHFELKNPSSKLYTADPDLTLMFFGTNPFKDSELRGSEDHFENLVADIERYAKAARGTVVVDSFIVSYRGAHGAMADQGHFFKLIKAYNKRLEELASQLPNLIILDTNRLVHKLGESNVFDLRGLYAFDIPFTHEFMTALAEEWTAYARALLGKTKKCIVLDLDNTLWGGVVGELGPLGVALGPDYPGNAFVNFQKALLDFYNRGIILAIASKNNPEDVEEIFKKNPYMVLKENNFSAIRVNWGDKAENIADIARELNIGVDSMVFLDDDPLMRAMVRGRLPGISVPEFSIPPEHYAQTLYDLDLFHQFALTEEDSQRGKMYAEEQQRKKVLSSAKSADDYIAELGIVMRVSMNDESLIPRISQLTQKTNQFNLTTRRHTEADIQRFIADGGLVFSGHVSDKFGDYGTVIVAIVTPGKIATLETFLMSCRVMGRGVECAFMDHIARVLHERGIATLHASFIPTAKNKPTEGFLPDHGFVRSDSEGFVLDIKRYMDKPCSKVNKAVTITR